ncbi:GNAT family N-acetyltransferase [Microbacterium sp. M28]|uniref:GNAT family N-acetyltransferase n=1 Tax=Microbacterium sp. M28 TaxID=2962064 RepID=UPI0021F42B83|nr:GNAT family N-acetyltransferase [Microbacterium sp. M28]UYO98629.1 GNAT family N-acetyltransferase [Microbacterium sp. M28]
MTTSVRRVRADEWREVRQLRLHALADAAAPIAFLDTLANATVRPDDFWQERTARAAGTDQSAQFVAIDGGEWVGSVSVLRRAVGDTDHHGRALEQRRSDVVGVYVRPSHRGQGIIDSLLAAASDWARTLGDPVLTLDVHADNDRAQSAYRRAGFAPTGFRFSGPIGPEIEMARSLDDAGKVRS